MDGDDNVFCQVCLFVSRCIEVAALRQTTSASAAKRYFRQSPKLEGYFKQIFQREKKIICCLWAKSWSGLNLGAGAKQASTLLQASGNMRVRIQSKMERGCGGGSMGVKGL